MKKQQTLVTAEGRVRTIQDFRERKEKIRLATSQMKEALLMDF